MVKSILERMSGNEAVAHAIKQVEPDVMPAFPITPSTELPQFVSNFIANGEIDTECRDWCIGSRSACFDSNFLLRTCFDVGSALCGRFQSSASLHGSSQPCVVRSAEYQQRAFRQYGSKRFRMDSDLCRKQSGSL